MKKTVFFLILFLMVFSSVSAQGLWGDRSGDSVTKGTGTLLSGSSAKPTAVPTEIAAPAGEPKPVVPVFENPFERLFPTETPVAVVPTEVIAMPTGEPKPAVPVFENPFARLTPTEVPTAVVPNEEAQVINPFFRDPVSVPPTQAPTAVPVVIETPDPLEGVETQRGITYNWYGDEVKLMIVYQPIMTRSQSGQTAEGYFVLFRVSIQNNSGKTISLKNESFTLSKEVNGYEIKFPLSVFFSYVTSRLWDLGILRDEILPGRQLDTYLVFDVDGAATDPWVFNFVPTERLTNTTYTPVKITLPKINMQ